MPTRRTRDELAAENEALYAELEDIHDRISDVLDEPEPDDDTVDVEGEDDE